MSRFAEKSNTIKKKLQRKLKPSKMIETKPVALRNEWSHWILVGNHNSIGIVLPIDFKLWFL